MKIIVNTIEFQETIKKLLRIVPAKTSLRIINENILLTVTDKAELIVNDLTVLIKIKLKNVNIVEGGSVLLTKETLKLAKKLKEDEMIITDKNIVSGKRKIDFIGMNPSDYPGWKNIDYKNHAFSLSKDKMLEITNITYACSDSDARSVLRGLLFSQNNVVACDACRLVIKQIEYNNNTKDMIFPSYVIDYIPILTDKHYKGEYNFSYDDENKYAKIEFDNITMEVVLIDGVYPDVKKVFPTHFKTEIRINKNKYLEELKVMKEIKNRYNIVTMNILDNILKITTESDDNRASLTSELEIEKSGENISIACNVDFLLDALKDNKNEYIAIKFSGELSPFVIDDECLISPYKKPKKTA